MSVILERTGSATTASYLRNPLAPGGIGGIISSGGNYYHYDGIGTVTALTNSTGAIVNTYISDAFGNVLSQTGTTPNSRTFLTKETSSTGLVYFGARYYDPRVGRFISADPSGMSDGPNVYLYCSNSPVNLVDPWGLCASKKEKSYWDYYWEALRRQATEPSYVSNRYLAESWGRAFGRLGTQFNPTPDKALRWGGRVVGESGHTMAGRSMGIIGAALDPGGPGKMAGMILGGTFGAGAASFIPVPGATIAGGIVGGTFGGWIGSQFDPPSAGQLNYNEWE